VVGHDVTLAGIDVTALQGAIESSVAAWMLADPETLGRRNGIQGTLAWVMTHLCQCAPPLDVTVAPEFSNVDDLHLLLHHAVNVVADGVLAPKFGGVHGVSASCLRSTSAMDGQCSPGNSENLYPELAEVYG
jgi:hypothetical protein